MTTLRVDEASDLAARALVGLGYEREEAATIADHLVDCELRGLGFSGLERILGIDERLGGEPPTTGGSVVTRSTPVSAQLDGRDRIGYLVAPEATAIAIDRARTSGIGIVGASGTWYTGMLSRYAEQITAAGLVAFVASSATAWVAPFGGTQARFGTNPCCFGFPADDVPLIWDIGVSEIIHAQAMVALRRGEALPEGVAYDAAGAATTDPAAALAGAFVAWGGHRGSGLGIVVQLLGALAGAPVQPGPLRDFGFLVLAIDPEVLGSADVLREQVVDFRALLEGTRPVDPHRPVRAPFSRSAADRSRRIREDAIEVRREVVERVSTLAAQAG